MPNSKSHRDTNQRAVGVSRKPLMDGAELWQTLILAVVQGITEFLPISSDGHLVIVGTILEKAFGTQSSESAKFQMTIGLHLGTLISLVIVYWRELWGLLGRPRLLTAVILGTIPAGVIGLAFEDFFEQTFSSPLIAGLGLYVTAALLLIGNRMAINAIELHQLPLKHAVAIGGFQVIAIFPGISRSGSTIAGGLMTGLTQHAATTFSFLLAVPVIGGAVLLQALKLLKGETLGHSMGLLAFGAIVSCVVGVAALRVLIRMVARKKLHCFAYYCLVVGTIVTCWQLWLKISVAAS